MAAQPQSKIFIALAAAVLAAIAPIPSTIVPEWKLRVVDLEGQPCVGKRVDQSWENYSLRPFSAGNLDERLTDDAGYIQFPDRTIWAPTVWRLVGPIIAALSALAHGNFGTHVAVATTGMQEGNKYWLEWEAGMPLPQELTVERCTSDRLRGK